MCLISAVGFISRMASSAILICSGVETSTLLTKQMSASLICVSTRRLTALSMTSILDASTRVMTGACSMVTTVLDSEYSAALFRPQGMATPDGSTTTMSGSNESWSLARVSAKDPAIWQHMHPPEISLAFSPWASMNLASTLMSPTSLTTMAILWPLLVSPSTIFMRAVVFPLPRKPAICAIFMITPHAFPVKGFDARRAWASRPP